MDAEEEEDAMEVRGQRGKWERDRSDIGALGEWSWEKAMGV